MPAECVALILEWALACRTAHSAVQKGAFAQNARRVLSSTAADASKYVTQRSTYIITTIATRRATRAHGAMGTTTDACLGSAARTTIVATATPGWLTKMDTAALIAHRVTELVQRAAPVQPVHPANA